MANFPVNPFRFVPEGLIIDDGPADRVVRSHVALPAEAPSYHGEYAIAVTDRQVAELERPALLSRLVDLLRFNHNVEVHSARSSPFGIGLFRFGTVMTRDTIVEGHGFQLDEATRVSFVRHDEALNYRRTPAGEERWILLIGFPWITKLTPSLRKPALALVSLCSGMTHLATIQGFWCECC
jgi:hypothetical protein